MKINSTTELMKNQKHAVVMGPSSQFEVLQTQSGNSLFFSIGTDNAFYLTQENINSATGWALNDITKYLSDNYLNSAVITAKCFDVAQDLTANTTDIVLVINDGSADRLFVSFGNVNTDDAWANAIANKSISFLESKFDDGSHNFSPLHINDVNLVQSGTTEYLIADVLQNPSDPTQLLFRYFVDPLNKVFPQKWTPHNLNGNLSAGAVTNQLGRKNGQAMDGVYTLGRIDDVTQLSYTPLYTITKKGSPDPTPIVPPEGATAMALSVSKAPFTDMFVAANGSLYYASYTAQLSNSTPGLIYSHALLQGVKSLHVNNSSSQTIIWGVNEQGQLFYMSCAAGSEANSSAWSYPVAILSNVENVATYIHTAQKNLVLFAHMNDDNTLIQLTQDPVTTHWVQRSIMLPSTDPDDLVETYTFTTHVQITDDYNVPEQNQAISISSTSNCSVYINDVYYTMFSGVPLQVTSDLAGVLTIVQSVDTLAGVSFFLTDGVMPTPENVNPFNNILDKLNPTRSDKPGVTLTDKTVYDEMGNSKPLVASTNDIQEMESYINKFLTLANSGSGIPDDGTQQPDDSLEAASATSRKIFGIQIVNGRMHYYDNVEDAVKLGVKRHVQQAQAAAGLVGDSNEIEVLAGDGWNWLKHAVADVVHFEVDLLGNVNHFVFTIAEQSYHFALKACHDLANGIHFVLNKIKVAFEDMVKFLGTIFAWNDFLRTHAAFKKVVLLYNKYAIGEIDNYIDQITNLTTTIEKDIDNWADLPTDSYQTQAQANADKNNSGQQNPSSNWASHHTKGNANNASGTDQADTDISSPASALLQAVIDEGEIIESAAGQLRYVINNAKSSSMDTIVKQIVGIVADTMLESAENVLTELLKMSKSLVDDAIEGYLDKPIKIPVISSVYRTFAKAELSVLDLICLIGAIPATIVYKLANKGVAPFPDDASVKEITDLQTFDDLITLCSPQAMEKGMVGITYDNNMWDSNSTYQRINFIANIFAMVGGPLIALLGTLKAEEDATQAHSKPLFVIYAGCYILYMAPDIAAVIQNSKSSNWYEWLNCSLAGIGFIKSCLDLKTCWDPKNTPAKAGIPGIPPIPASDQYPDGVPGVPAVPAKGEVDNRSGYTRAAPWADMIINGVWELPVYYSYKNSKRLSNDIISLSGNTAFNASGVLSPFIDLAEGVPKQVLIGLAAVFNVGYGFCSGFYALDNYSND